MFEVFEYETPDGKNHYKEWFDALPSDHARKVATAIRRMEAGNFGVHKGVGNGVLEHKIYNPALRIYYALDGKNVVILLVGGSKSHQDRDIQKAHKLWARYKEENR